MPRRTNRQRRSENIMTSFIVFCKVRAQHLRRRNRRQRRAQVQQHLAADDAMDIDSDIFEVLVVVG